MSDEGEYLYLPRSFHMLQPQWFDLCIRGSFSLKTFRIQKSFFKHAVKHHPRSKSVKLVWLLRFLLPWIVEELINIIFTSARHFDSEYFYFRVECIIKQCLCSAKVMRTPDLVTCSAIISYPYMRYEPMTCAQSCSNHNRVALHSTESTVFDWSEW